MNIYIRGERMKQDYEKYSKAIKALSDSNRLQIIDMLSCGEMCACDILEHFDFTQPTLSHHMKVLADANLVNIRKDGVWNYYSLNMAECNKVVLFLLNIFTESEDCICRNVKKNNC
jgi:ArsR family transcriptional regulator